MINNDLILDEEIDLGSLFNTNTEEDNSQHYADTNVLEELEELQEINKEDVDETSYEKPDTKHDIADTETGQSETLKRIESGDIREEDMSDPDVTVRKAATANLYKIGPDKKSYLYIRHVIEDDECAPLLLLEDNIKAFYLKHEEVVDKIIEGLSKANLRKLKLGQINAFIEIFEPGSAIIFTEKMMPVNSKITKTFLEKITLRYVNEHNTEALVYMSRSLGRYSVEATTALRALNLKEKKEEWEGIGFVDYVNYIHYMIKQSFQDMEFDYIKNVMHHASDGDFPVKPRELIKRVVKDEYFTEEFKGRIEWLKRKAKSEDLEEKPLYNMLRSKYEHFDELTDPDEVLLVIKMAAISFCSASNKIFKEGVDNNFGHLLMALKKGYSILI